MANPLEREVVVKEGGASTSPQYDRHRDPTHPPTITSVLGGITVGFDNDPPNNYYRPIDAAVKVRIDVPAGPNIPQGSVLAIVKFGSEWVDSEGRGVPPMAYVTEEGTLDPPVWRTFGITSTQFVIRNDFTLIPPQTLKLRFGFDPAT